MHSTVDVKFPEYRKQLEKVVSYFKDGGKASAYRLETAKIALQVADSVGEVSQFLKPEISTAAVERMFPEEDKHRKQDVAKMLYVELRSLTLDSRLSNEVKENLKKREKHRGVPKLVLV